MIQTMADLDENFCKWAKDRGLDPFIQYSESSMQWEWSDSRTALAYSAWVAGKESLNDQTG